MGVFKRERGGGGDYKRMKIDGIKLPVTADEREVKNIAIKKSGIKNPEYFKILKKSIDARDKNDIKFVYSAEIGHFAPKEEEIVLPRAEKEKTIIITGFGPAGIFCALYLARAGYKPIVIERGKNADERAKSVKAFAESGVLDENSNVQFGEGGAGTFSDGKLNTGVSSPLIKTVLKDFVSFGAPKEIEYLAKPHIGSDKLPSVVKNIRKEIERLGGKVLFGKKLEKVNFAQGKAVSVIINGVEQSVDDLVLAVGHSARDTFYMLADGGVKMERKQFAMGFRIEHKQAAINRAQYGEKFAAILPAADYRLASHVSVRGVFTFCMCPGGFVMPAASESGGVVTNGMSLFSRSGENANSAVLCEVYPSDFCEGLLGGVELQRKIERATYALGGGDYSAPVQTLGDFFADKPTNALGGVKPTYPRYRGANLNSVYPSAIINAIKSGLTDMDKKLKGFASAEAILTGAETRSSSPIRILRDDKMRSLSADNLYPCGEGCGYAGGIMSAAVDGIKTAKAICEKYSG